MKYVEVVGGILLNPREYTRLVIREKNPFIHGIFTVIFTSLGVSFLSSAIVWKLMPIWIRLMGFSIANAPYVYMAIQMLIPSIVLISIICWALWGTLTHFLARAFGGGADLTVFLGLLGYSWASQFLILLTLFFFPIYPPATLYLIPFAVAGSILWSLYVTIHVVEELYILTRKEAVIATLTPPLAFTLLYIFSIAIQYVISLTEVLL